MEVAIANKIPDAIEINIPTLSIDIGTLYERNLKDTLPEQI